MVEIFLTQLLATHSLLTNYGEQQVSSALATPKCLAHENNEKMIQYKPL